MGNKLIPWKEPCLPLPVASEAVLFPILRDYALLGREEKRKRRRRSGFWAGGGGTDKVFTFLLHRPPPRESPVNSDFLTNFFGLEWGRVSSWVGRIGPPGGRGTRRTRLKRMCPRNPSKGKGRRGNPENIMGGRRI